MQLGRYEILEPIGLGASSTVFKARDTLIGRIVAIKTLQSGLTDPAWRDRFMAEARIVGQLSHPRIVKLHDVGIDETSGAPYLVMEYVVGETLEKYLAARKPQLQQALAWGAALARALSYAHQQGIVHGDIKPANIMINQDGRVMVTDFGDRKSTRLKLQSHVNLVCRLLLEKKKKTKFNSILYRFFGFLPIMNFFRLTHIVFVIEHLSFFTGIIALWFVIVAIIQETQILYV